MSFRVGMIGTIDHINLFAPKASSREDIEFVGIAEPDEKRGQEMADQFKTKHFKTKDQLLDQNLDAVGVFSPFYEKADDIACCINQGLHVMADKPMATNAAGLEKVREALDANPGVKFTMGLTERTLPIHLKLKEMIEDGAIGKMVVFDSRKSYAMRRPSRPGFMFDEKLSGGEWVELAVHDIDFIRWISGKEYLSVSATHGNVSSPEESFQDHGVGLFRMTDGLSAFLQHDRLNPNGNGKHLRRGMRFVGSEGVIELGGGQQVLWNAQNECAPIEDLPKGLPMFGNFIDAIQNGAELIVPADDVLRITEVAMAAYQSSNQRGKMVDLETREAVLA